MNDYERFEVRRMLLMQQTERQKELAESRYAPEKDPEMIMGYEVSLLSPLKGLVRPILIELLECRDSCLRIRSIRG